MSTSKLAVSLFLITIVGTPLAGYLWETLNQLLSGTVAIPRLLISLPAAIVLGLLLWFLARAIEGWAVAEHEGKGSPPPA